jgi:hypothetical protein
MIEKLIALIIGMGLVAAGATEYKKIQDGADAAAAEQNVSRIVDFARSTSGMAQVNGRNLTVEQVLLEAVDSLDRGSLDITVTGLTVTSVIGDACYQATLTDLDSKALYEVCTP